MNSNRLLDSYAGTVLSREIDEVLLHLRGLVLVRDLLAERGATRSEIQAHSNEIERLRGRLVGMISGPANPARDQELVDAA